MGKTIVFIRSLFKFLRIENGASLKRPKNEFSFENGSISTRQCNGSGEIRVSNFLGPYMLNYKFELIFKNGLYFQQSYRTIFTNGSIEFSVLMRPIRKIHRVKQ